MISEGTWTVRQYSSGAGIGYAIDAPYGRGTIAQDILGLDDARVMAAAPAMLAALQDLVALIDNGELIVRNLFALNGEVVRSRAAIAAATGGPTGDAQAPIDEPEPAVPTCKHCGEEKAGGPEPLSLWRCGACGGMNDGES